MNFKSLGSSVDYSVGSKWISNGGRCSTGRRLEELLEELPSPEAAEDVAYTSGYFHNSSLPDDEVMMKQLQKREAADEPRADEMDEEPSIELE